MGSTLGCFAQTARARPEGEDAGRVGVAGAAEGAWPGQGGRRGLPAHQEETPRAAAQTAAGTGKDTTHREISLVLREKGIACGFS